MKSITQEQYDLLHPYLPVQRGNVSISNLTLINAVLYVAENGCKWRALPKEFGNWNTVYVRIHRWATKVHMVAANDRCALTFSLSPLTFSLSPGNAHDGVEGRKLLSDWHNAQQNMPLA